MRLSRSLLLVAALGAAGGVARADAPLPTSDETPRMGLGLQGHGQFVPGAILSPFLQQYQSSESGGFGASFVRHKGTLDIVLTLDVSFFNPADGNFLGSGKDPALDTHWVEFKGLTYVSADVSFIYNRDIATWKSGDNEMALAFMAGVGIGLGVVAGDIYVVNNSKDCTAANAGDPAKCHPVVTPTVYTAYGNPTPTWTDSAGKQQSLSGPILPSDPNFQAKLDGLARSQEACQAKGGNTDCRDTAEHPYYHKSGDKPPVLPLINVMIGLKLKLERHWNVNISGGFRNGFVVGAGPEYIF